jgi:hypothetical protein
MGRPPDRGVAANVLIAFRVTEQERNAYQSAADASGLSLSDWIRKLCERAAMRRS